ncbi:uncharacterized protein BDW43DRAFT_312604 [Aspergillus alliaceus]|uniref:uncharacterized protein n=1 Tax=Petromyces alliaceus TaxID=209559 RepID=UPI0012A53571|nr:uncharacterized protein BDW43DRAFT_312604 [Aspergillus alliaceus]KAB8231987.1 hypothetical protein BDW43DRAFT_312604 [Aspergillus alliaceus]
MFINYYAAPYKTSKHVHPFKNQIDFNNCRAILLEGGEDSQINLITVQGFCNVIARAVEYEGVWPIVGDIKGDELKVGQLIAIGGKVRGGPFAVVKMKAEDLKAGVVKSTWLPKVDHPAIPVQAGGFTSREFRVWRPLRYVY